MSDFPTRELPTRPAAPAWGQLSDEGRTASVVRFAVPGRTWTFPYHVLQWWSLEAGDTETLSVHAGAQVITLRGRKLAAIRDALDSGRAELVQQMSDRSVAANAGDTVVHSLTVQPPAGAE